MRNVISRWAASGAIAGCPPPAAGPSAAPAPPLPSPPPRIPQSSRASAALAAGTGGVRKQKAYAKRRGTTQAQRGGGFSQPAFILISDKTRSLLPPTIPQNLLQHCCAVERS
jgi:hypothetical protein